VRWDLEEEPSCRIPTYRIYRRENTAGTLLDHAVQLELGILAAQYLVGRETDHQRTVHAVLTPGGRRHPGVAIQGLGK
jgi:hypothetical protein